MDQALKHEGSGRMEFPRAGRRSGWSDMENKLLWETADEAQQQGLPLKAVFEQIARQTGRRPNSIRNYYYAQVRQHDGGAELARACDVLTQYLEGRRSRPEDALAEAVRGVIGPIKEFVALDSGARMEAAQAFCDDIAGRIGALEEKLDEARR